MPMQSRIEETFHADGRTVFDHEFWNRFVREVAARFRGFESLKISWDEVSRQGVEVALTRINESIGPAAERIRRLTELGFLVATSDTLAVIEAGAILRLELTPGDNRELFSPAPFLLLGRVASPDDYAVVRLVAFDRERGELTVEVVTAAGDPGPWSDWSIGALAGSTVAQLVMLDEARSMHRDAMGAAERLGRAASEASQSAQLSETSRRAAQLLYEATVAAARPLTKPAIEAALGFAPETSTWLLQDWDYTAENGQKILANTSAGGWALTLPAHGVVEVLDPNGAWAANHLTIVGPVQGVTGNMICDQSGGLRFVRLRDASAWTVTKTQGVSA